MSGSGSSSRNGKNTSRYKWWALFWIALAELFALSLWFSASAVLPQLEKEWGMDAVAGSWMTTSVQIGFIIGAVVVALSGISDRFDPRRIFAIASVFGAIVNGLFSLSSGTPTGLILRFFTGIAMASIYPIAVKLLSIWFPDRREVGIGILIAALTLGSSSPHLMILLIPNVNWKIIVLMSSLLALLAAAIMTWILPKAPDSTRKTTGLTMNSLKPILQNRPGMLANYGYFGHMWELYAMGTWLPYFLTAILKTFLEVSDLQETSTLFAFLTVGLSGAIGSVVG
ncbi:MFS transporter, partial [Paenibacillus riograndensis]